MEINSVLNATQSMWDGYPKKINNEPPKKMWGDVFEQPVGTVFGLDTSKSIFSIINESTSKAEPLETTEPPGIIQMAYLQYPNEFIKEVAFQIVSPSDSNDEKAHKLQRFVAKYIAYMTDEEQYGEAELWIPPIMTLISGKADCEDQAFLLHSLMLNAEIPSYRIRTYGGLVEDPAGGEGGHGWTSYMRESDNEWVVLDTTYYPNLSPVSLLPLMEDDERYIDDMFFFSLTETVLTPGTNRVRNPDMLPTYTNSATLLFSQNNSAGTWINDFV